MENLQIGVGVGMLELGRQLGLLVGTITGWSRLRTHIAEAFAVPYDMIIQEISWGPAPSDASDSLAFATSFARVDLLGPFSAEDSDIEDGGLSVRSQRIVPDRLPS